MKNYLKILIPTLLSVSIVSISSTAYAWDSNENIDIMDTHKTIAVQALEIIKNDLKNDSKIIDALNELHQNLVDYKSGSVAPDFGKLGIDRDYKLYQDHFYDPDSGKNFTANYPYPFYEISDTAESQVRNYFSQAVATWKDGNHKKGSYLLGKAMHYFADLNEPHHVLNWIGGPGTSHTNFESYAEKTKDNYKLFNIFNAQEEFNNNLNLPILDFLTYESNKYSTLAKDLEPKVSMSNSWSDWDDALNTSLKNAQKSSAIIAYRFLKEVSSDKTITLTTPIKQFHVTIETSDESNSGSNDYIYFGMELTNGKTKEFNCDLPGNDFTISSNSSYQFYIGDQDFNPSDIKRVWIRKQNYLTGDDLKIKNISIYMQGKRVLNETINQWLSGNYTHNFFVNGLK